MFGFGKHKKLAKHIESFMRNWALVQALDANLAGVDNPPNSPLADYGILWGATDSLGQAYGFDLDTTAKGLKHYLAQFSDGNEMFSLIIAAPFNPECAAWIELAGNAVHAITTGKDPMKTLLPIAEKYRLGFS